MNRCYCTIAPPVNILNTRKRTIRYARTDEAVLDAAAALFNEHGLKGVTLGAVAAQVGLTATSLTYYYGRKEDLAVACLSRSIQVLDRLVATAARGATLRARVTAFIEGYMTLLGEVADGTRPALMSFHDMRALTTPGAAGVFRDYENLFRRVRSLVARPGIPSARLADNARSYLLLALATDIDSWLGRYERDDYPRVARCIADLLLGGLGHAVPDATPPPPVPDEGNGAATPGRDAFLRTATELVNEQGYHGASVAKIACRLDLTKGAFYHYNASRDDLLERCFERSFAVVRSLQRAASGLPGCGARRIGAATGWLLCWQLSPRGPLLRHRALRAVPAACRSTLLASRARLAERFAGMIFDGIADGSLRTVDPVVAAQLLDGMINAGANLRRWAPGITADNVVELFARPFYAGLEAGSATGPAGA